MIILLPFPTAQLSENDRRHFQVHAPDHTKMSSGISSFFSSLFPVIKCEGVEPEKEPKAEAEEEEAEEPEDVRL